MNSRSEIEEELSKAIAKALEYRIKESGKASLLVSGGSTPVNMFELLSHQAIDWSKVTVSIVDERFVPKNHLDSNALLVRKNLLKNAAKEARFIPLVVDEKDNEVNLMTVRRVVSGIEQPYTVVVLGMGTDGHTASLFPESPQLEAGMDLNTEEILIITEPKTAPYERISFTRKALLNTEHLFLHCYGAQKQAILEEIKADQNNNKYPISQFIYQDKVKPKIYWAN